MSQNENITPEEFTKQISPMKDGIRASIEKTGHMNYVHKWMSEYNDLKSKPLQEEVSELKLKCDNWSKMHEEMLQLAVEYKSRISELEIKNEWIQVSDRLPRLEIHTVGNITTRNNSYECIVSDGITSWVDYFTLDEGFHKSIIKWRPIPKP